MAGSYYIISYIFIEKQVIRQVKLMNDLVSLQIFSYLYRPIKFYLFYFYFSFLLLMLI